MASLMTMEVEGLVVELPCGAHQPAEVGQPSADARAALALHLAGPAAGLSRCHGGPAPSCTTTL